MLDIPDPIFADSTASTAARSQTELPRPADSPLRPWGMWGGWGALGVVCAASVAHAFSVFGRTVGRPG